MRTSSSVVVAVCAVFCLIMSTAGSASASIVEYEVGVDGFGCPMCADSLEKRLGPLDGTENLEIDIGPGIASFDVAGGELLWPDTVVEAVEDSNLSVRDINLVARGTVERDGDDWRLRFVDGESLRLVGGEAFGRLTETDGDEIEVTGAVVRDDGEWQLETDAVEVLDD